MVLTALQHQSLHLAASMRTKFSPPLRLVVHMCIMRSIMHIITPLQLMMMDVQVLL
ncbi:hypothetical protein FBUS_06467 [Fasciolopsis buskii]|uniref:Uncharacterized protein n=1 Tax=Fasciolopsis buskii TaxID=27845 RepID=A0A8E0S2P6_9TREM|nr:hypothetical protein FBUS_06467 [Fasciolopsis buski]